MEQNNIVVDSTIFALTNASIVFDDEQVYLQMFSGNAMRRYQLSPKHAKRLMLSLSANVAEYEKRFGDLKTELQKGPQQETKTSDLGFSPSN